MDSGALYRLMTWLSPSFPVGAYSYSHGLEYAVAERLVEDHESLVGWVGAILAWGNGHADGVLFCAAWRSASLSDVAALNGVNEIAAAFRGTREIALESSAQGTAFSAMARTAWNVPVLSALADANDGAIAYPVAVGAACASGGISLASGLSAYLHAFAANLVSAGVRLIPLGQSDGQRAIAALEPHVGASTERALGTSLEELGTSTPVVDWTSMKHERQHTRLFRS
jgi:urease accessory protein